MANDNSVINLGDFSKPATVLIEKVSDAIGGIFKPFQLVRVAEASSKAMIIRAKADNEISEIQLRAANRFLIEEGNKQDNIEKITAKAASLVNEEADPEGIDNDWITYFFDKCRIVSDSEMQQVWSRILAGEANKPGSFSRRTLNLMETLDKSDAFLFLKLCSFALVLSGGNVFPYISDDKEDIYRKNGINFESLTHLDSIGLINYTPLSGFVFNELPKKCGLGFRSTGLVMRFLEGRVCDLEVGKVLFTDVGHQIFTICAPEEVEGFEEHFISALSEVNLRKVIFSSEWPQRFDFRQKSKQVLL